MSARVLDSLGAEFFACMQEFASKRGMSCSVAPRAVTVTEEQAEAYELSLRHSLMADVRDGRLTADVWLTEGEQATVELIRGQA